MPSPSDFLNRKPTITAMINSYFGGGKTLQAHSFPRCYTISCDPAGLETLRQPTNKKFLDNLVWFEELHNESEVELKKLFRETARSDERDSVYGCLAHCRELAAKGEIDTLVMDGANYFVDMKWQAICEFEEVRSEKSGEKNSQAMYRNLGLYLQRFFASDLLTMATRNGLNVICTFHLKRESEETVQGSDKIKNRAKKVALNSDIAPLIEGGFRARAEGLFGASIYLDRRIKEGKVVYEAICGLAPGLGTIVNAKNRFGLPARLDLTDKSLYEAIMNSLRVKGSATAATATTAKPAIAPPPTATPTTAAKVN
jgi:hypothetical protein